VCVRVRILSQLNAGQHRVSQMLGVDAMGFKVAAMALWGCVRIYWRPHVVCSDGRASRGLVLITYM
jgi:hypothetical protein